MPRCGGSRLRVGLHGHDEEISDLAVRDKGFRAVDHVVVALANGARLDGRQVGASSGLGHCNPEQDLAADRARQVLSLLFLRPVVHEIRHANVGVERDHHRVRSQVRHFLHDHHVVQEVPARAAVLHWGCCAEKAVQAGTAPRLPIAHAAGVPLGDARGDFPLGEAPELIPKEAMIFAEDIPLHWTAALYQRARCSSANPGMSANSTRSPAATTTQPRYRPNTYCTSLRRIPKFARATRSATESISARTRPPRSAIPHGR